MKFFGLTNSICACILLGCLQIKSEKYAYIFAHGLGANASQAKPYSLLVPKAHNLTAFDFQDALAKPLEYDRQSFSFGQEPDMEMLHTTCSHYPSDYKLILIGLSRGAAAVINYTAHYKPKNVAAIILESPFDSLDSVVQHLLERYNMSWLPMAHAAALYFSKTYFPNVNHEGIFPHKSVDLLEPHIPVIFIHSQKDRVVPIKSSRALYYALKTRGHEHVYLFEMALGAHGKLMEGSESDIYSAIIHAFYQKHNLPHDLNAAEYGAPLLRFCKPPLEEIKKKLKKDRRVQVIQSRKA